MCFSTSSKDIRWGFAAHFWAPAAGCTGYIPILSSVPLCAVGEQTHSAESRGAAGGNAGNGGASQPPSPRIHVRGYHMVRNGGEI